MLTVLYGYSGKATLVRPLTQNPETSSVTTSMFPEKVWNSG